MKIAMGNDHVAFGLKNHIKKYLEDKGHTIVDFGAHSDARCDYPVYGKKVALAVAGISLAANKVKGIRAAVCSEPYTARLTKQHNNANIIAFGARVVGEAMAEMIVDEYLSASFEGGRHQGRIDMISDIESEQNHV